jgi:hypothetical protein
VDHVKLQKQWKHDFEEESDMAKCLRTLPPAPVSWTRWVDNSSSDSRREIWTFADDQMDDDEKDDTYDDGEPKTKMANKKGWPPSYVNEATSQTQECGELEITSTRKCSLKRADCF